MKWIFDLISLVAKLPDLIRFLSDLHEKHEANAKEAEAVQRRDDKIAAWDSAVDAPVAVSPVVSLPNGSTSPNGQPQPIAAELPAGIRAGEAGGSQSP